MHIILDEGETIDAVTICGYKYPIIKSDISELSDGRRIVSLLHGGRRVMRERTPIDTSKLKVMSSTGPVLDRDGIISGGAA